MRYSSTTSAPLSGKLAVLLLSFAVGIPALAQSSQSTGDTQNMPPSATAQQQPSGPPTATVPQPKEGFWGHMNPWARKKWVKRQTDPINDRLSELDDVNAKNARDIQDVDSIGPRPAFAGRSPALTRPTNWPTLQAHKLSRPTLRRKVRPAMLTN